MTPKHFENRAILLDLKGVKPAPTPMSKSTGRNARDTLDPLGREAKAAFCRGTGICMYLGPDRFDVQFTVKALASDMSSPVVLSMSRLRRCARYLFGTADVGIEFAYQDRWDAVVVWTDGDWSGDVLTCKSTSAGAIQIGSHTVETWSVSQQVVSLSSAESEFYAIGSGAARGITVNNVMLEMALATEPAAVPIQLVLRTDSDAARGMLHRVGSAG